MGDLKYRTVLLKLSGEALSSSDKGASLDWSAFEPVAQSIEECLSLGARMAIVVGGGNLLRGRQIKGTALSDVRADQLGMLATTINALALEDYWRRRGFSALALSSVAVGCWIRPYEPFVAREALDAGRLVILAGGTGNTHFTTDTAAALRAVELEVDVLFKATKVNGVFSEDPLKNPNAVHYPHLTFWEALNKKLEIMDQTAFALCCENNLKVLVFSMQQPANLVAALKGEAVGTIVEKGAET